MLAAHHLVAQFRRGERTARDTIAGALFTISEQQEQFNASTLIDDERALSRAEMLDDTNATTGPLAGVPIAIKDMIDHVDRPTTCGSSFYAEIPDRTSTCVQRLEDAGAVIVSRTNLHEFAYGFSSENHWFGPVRNPLDDQTSAGGSSGGSAAAVAAGQVPIAIGTDTGGSVRVPAALCGIYGLKVTHGRIPLTGVFPLATSLDTVGPLATDVNDLTLAYRVLAGYDPDDPWSVRRPVTSPGGARPDLSGVRIAVPVPWVDDAPISEEVAEAFSGAVARLEALGAVVETVDDPVISVRRELGDLSGAEISAVHREWFEAGREYGPGVAERLAVAMRVSSDEYVRANGWRVQIRRHFAHILSSHDLIITPATGVTSKQIGRDTVDTIEGEVFHRTALSHFTALVNVAGNPALVGPLNTDGTPPPALQLIAPFWGEHRLLEIAATLVDHGVMK